jgi:hypothetical protein
MPASAARAALPPMRDPALREGVARSLPVPSGRRLDKTLFSLLPRE